MMFLRAGGSVHVQALLTACPAVDPTTTICFRLDHPGDFLRFWAIGYNRALYQGSMGQITRVAPHLPCAQRDKNRSKSRPTPWKRPRTLADKPPRGLQCNENCAAGCLTRGVGSSSRPRKVGRPRGEICFVHGSPRRRGAHLHSLRLPRLSHRPTVPNLALAPTSTHPT